MIAKIARLKSVLLQKLKNARKKSKKQLKFVRNARTSLSLTIKEKFYVVEIVLTSQVD